MISSMPRWRAVALRPLVALGLSLVVLAGLPVAASAHGDPASHYLEHDLLYPAFGDRPTVDTELDLLGLLAAARDDGFPLRVALIADPSDLTEDPTMLTRPQAYADYVAGELDGLATAGALVLVLTPSGYGLSGTFRPAEGAPRLLDHAGSRTLLGGLSAAGHDGESLARSAMVATRELARLSGHPLPDVVPPLEELVSSTPTQVAGSTRSGWWLPIGVFALVMVLAVVAFETRRWSARREIRAPLAANHAPATALALAAPSTAAPDRASQPLSHRTKVPHQKEGQ